MIKKFAWPYSLRWLSLFIALALLFIGLLASADHHPLSAPARQREESKTASDSFCFAFLSDLHKGWGVFKPIMKEIASKGDSFAIIGGDVVAQDSADRYRFFFRQLATVRDSLPLYFAPGNHDVYDKSDNYGLRNFHTYCGPDQYWFSFGNAAFVVLNDARVTISEDQFRWLESNLQQLRNAFPHIFVVMHVPTFDPQQGRSYSLRAPIGKRFMHLMERFKVDSVFTGHLHCYFRKVVNGVTYLGAPSAGGTLRCANSLYYGYIRIVVQGQRVTDSLVKVKNERWLQLKGDVRYELRVRSSFLLPLTAVTGQSFLYFFAA
jgi:UDP-2,3-diacylglucosamine pyrophosphatase LpxH